MIRRAAVVAVLALGVSVSAQRGNTTLNPINQPQRQQPPVFRSGVELVHLDVSVLDGNRRPVRGLGPADFTVTEDGKPQNIAVFSAVDIPDVEVPKVPWIRDIAPEAGGLHAISLGLSALAGDDDHGLLERGFIVYDALFAWLRFAAEERHNWPAKAA